MKTINPNDAIIIGLDTEHKEGEHMLWDERAFEAPEAKLVASIKQSGVVEPILLTKAKEVVNGRKRIMAARKVGLDAIPCMYLNGNAETMGDAAALMVELNEIRQDDPLHVKASKAHRLVETHGLDAKALATSFGVGTKQLGNYVKYHGLAKAVKKAVEAGKVSLTAAVQLHKLTAKEQGEELAKLLKGGKKPTVRRAKATAAKRFSDPPSKKEVMRLCKATGFTAEDSDEEAVALVADTGLNQDFFYGAMWAVGEYDVARDLKEASGDKAAEAMKALLKRMRK